MPTVDYANSAFGAANSAGSYANSAFLSSNTKAKITELTALSSVSANTDNTVFVVVDLSSGIPTTKKLTLTKLDQAIDNSGNLAFGAANAASSYANSAFLIANTPTNVANSAASYANGAFIKANTPSYTANSADLYANSAFLKANTPDYVANSASSYANAGFAVANSASSYANAGFAQANTGVRPQNIVATNYVLAASDAGKHIYYTAAANSIIYIPLTSSVSFANGTTIMIVSKTTLPAANITLTPNSGVTLVLGGTATTGSRNVNANGIATIMQVAANTWFLTGSGIGA